MLISLSKYFKGKFTYDHLKRKAGNNTIVLFPETNSMNQQILDSIISSPLNADHCLFIFCNESNIQTNDVKIFTIHNKEMSTLMYYISLNQNIAGEFLGTSTIIASLNGQYLGNDYNSLFDNGIFTLDYLTKTRILHIKHSIIQASQQSP